MDIKYIYSKSQLEAAVNFIGNNNQSFINRFDYIRSSILTNMSELAGKFPDCYYIGTMGYLISGDVISEESIDSDDNTVMFDITVDPAVSQDKWIAGDSVSTMIKVSQNDVTESESA